MFLSFCLLINNVFEVKRVFLMEKTLKTGGVEVFFEWKVFFL